MVHVAVAAEIAHRAGVQAARHGLVAGDQFHGADLWCAHQSAGGKGGGEEIKRVPIRCQLSLDAADDMHDMTVALDGAIGIHTHAACLGDPTQIVAGEIHQHDVLGVLLWVAEQFRLQILILLRRAAPRSGAGDRTQ